MQIGKPIRKIIVEPLESPVPTNAPDPDPDERKTVAPTHQPEPEPERKPATP